MGARLSHLGLAVAAHDDVIVFWRDLLGLTLSPVEHVESEGVAVAMLALEPRADGTGGAIELLQPDPGDNAVARFLDKRGPGIHHVALSVDDIDGLVHRLREHRVRLINAEPRPGAHGTRVVFVHPKSTGGVLVELVQEPAGDS